MVPMASRSGSFYKFSMMVCRRLDAIDVASPVANFMAKGTSSWVTDPAPLADALPLPLAGTTPPPLADAPPLASTPPAGTTPLEGTPPLAAGEGAPLAAGEAAEGFFRLGRRT